MRRRLPDLAIVGQILFTVGWILGGVLQGKGYSVARHDISDIGAMTAHAPAVFIVAIAVAGITTILFALLSLRPAMHVGC